MPMVRQVDPATGAVSDVGVPLHRIPTPAKNRTSAKPGWALLAQLAGALFGAIAAGLLGIPLALVMAVAEGGGEHILCLYGAVFAWPVAVLVCLPMLVPLGVHAAGRATGHAGFALAAVAMDVIVASAVANLCDEGLALIAVPIAVLLATLLVYNWARIVAWWELRVGYTETSTKAGG